MNAKQLKFLELFAQMVRNDNLAQKDVLKKCLKNFLELDYSLAVDAWDYLASTYEPDLNSNPATAELFGQTAFEAFYNKASTKCIKALADTPSIRKAVYMYNPKAVTGDNFTIFVDLLSANKVADAEEILKCLQKNNNIQYGAKLKEVLERVFIEILKKNPSKKIEMSKKLSTLLLTYIAKIKTDERSMLEQRIRETL